MQNEQEPFGDVNEMKQMKVNWVRVVAAGVLAGFGLSAQASLVVPAGNSLVVNDTDLNITWTQDANLFKTQASSYAGGASAFVTAVINAVGGTITDTPNTLDKPTPNSGSYALSSTDFNTGNGRMTWWGAQAWVGYLNSISYADQTGWRLPTALNQDASGPCSGYNCTGSELGHLYYTELNKVAYPAPNFGILGTGTFSDTSGSVGPFSNVHTSAYWSGTEYAPNPTNAWLFETASGYQGGGNKGYTFYGWAVRPGQVAAVPVPAAVWLMGSGLLGLLGWGRRTAGTLVLG